MIALLVLLHYVYAILGCHLFRDDAPQQWGTLGLALGSVQPMVLVMLHRATLGSLERFLGILIEHFEGKFPLWLAPEQVRVLPISDKSADYARELFGALKAAGLRATLDDSDRKSTRLNSSHRT